MKQNSNYDVLVLGSGIAGLSFANYFLETQLNKPEQDRLSLAVISKGGPSQTNTAWAQGGIAAPIQDSDSIDLHVEDTLVAGSFVNDLAITKKIIQQAPKAIQDLVRWGVDFDVKEDGHYDLGLEGGHSKPRILHHQDITGAAVQKGILSYFLSLDGELKNYCKAIQVKKVEVGYEVLCYDVRHQTIHTLTCAQLVLATGGLGQLFEHTTNTTLSNGEGIYFAHQLGARLRDLAFIQFHPTGLYTTDGQDFLISEALRGAGATLLNSSLIPFMLNYDPRGDLAPRDVVSRAIWQEMKRGNHDFVYLDATHLSADLLNKHFSHLIEGCLKRTGIDLRKNPIPVTPMQHYSCGGIWTDEFGLSSLSNLFAVGECASTGFHGANRLASNSLLEGICMANFAVMHSLGTVSAPKALTHRPSKPELTKVYLLNKSELQKILSEVAGVVRKKSSLQKGYKALLAIQIKAEESPFTLEAFENTVALNLSLFILEDAISKETSIGVHYLEEGPCV